jgi:hypothetical protein
VTSYKGKKDTGIKLQKIRTLKMGQKQREIKQYIALTKSHKLKKENNYT